MKRSFQLLLVLAVLVPCSLPATSIQERPLAELVAEADHIVVGTVTRVTMRDWMGREVRNLEAKTGPGFKNEIRLHISVETNGILKTNKRKFPSNLEVPLWEMWHYSFGGIKAWEGATNVFLLKGENLERVYPRYFRRDLSDKATILELIKNQSQK